MIFYIVIGESGAINIVLSLYQKDSRDLLTQFYYMEMK